MAGFTITQLEAIETALASGKLKVRYEGKEVMYQDTQSLIAARDVIRADLVARGLISDTPARGVASVLEFCRD